MTRTPPKAIILLMVVCCLLMLATEIMLDISYWTRSVIKTVLFLTAFLGGCLLLKVDILALFSFRSGKKALLSVGLGLLVFGVIWGAWLLLSMFIDPAAIAASLMKNMQVGADNFIWVFLYICLFNAMLEEVFFRGLGFLVLRRFLPGWVSWVFSAGIFAVYHMAMLRGFFSPVLYVLALAGLFVGGLLFNWLDSAQDSLMPGWLVHLFANLAINTIGLTVVGLV